jgi:hypothetical protein
MVHAASEEDAVHGAELYRKACRTGDRKPSSRPVIYRSVIPD